MPFVFAHRVQEDAGNKPDASTAYDLSGSAETGMRTFASQLADGDECVVLAEEVDADGNPAGGWEISECTYTDSTTDTLTRNTLLDSSTGSAIDWSTATGLDATPRLSLVDRATGMGRVIDRWVHSTDVAAVTFNIPTGRTDALFRFDFINCWPDSANAGVFLSARVRRSGQGSVDSGASDYEVTGVGRVRAAAADRSGTNTDDWFFADEGTYGESHASFDAHLDTISGFLELYGAADSGLMTRCAGIFHMPSSSDATGHAGTFVMTGLHENSASAIDQIQFFWDGGENFAGGRIEMREIG